MAKASIKLLLFSLFWYVTSCRVIESYLFNILPDSIVLKPEYVSPHTHSPNIVKPRTHRDLFIRGNA
jgi:hypothetical protein